MATIRFDAYNRYEAITGFLNYWVAEFPNPCQLRSFGQSYAGRDIWVVILTNRGTGSDEDKPAYWVDANIQATELAPSSAALHLIHKLLSEYGSVERTTYLLDSRVFYILPRLNPDGAEGALADIPKGPSLVSGQLKTILVHLAGWDDKRAMAIWGGDDTKERVKIEWVIDAEEASKVELIATH